MKKSEMIREVKLVLEEFYPFHGGDEEAADAILEAIVDAGMLPPDNEFTGLGE